ncbi:hypothetical protein UA08_07456 [Talaromyces atroroseus]|uniref:Proline iminopeptidase n=1 Tax=Talaromyces atroroseus TaxID=1441469 RepID=A0A225AGT6_TALAT|nr:hypothetical protein UA08_07456 [Talaromyces atroroseus]OKL57334.1 hypothetical protein UA08_07456 [Talaromyces atroroseus]
MKRFAAIAFTHVAPAPQVAQTVYFEMRTRGAGHASESERDELLNADEHALPHPQLDFVTVDGDFDYTGSSRRSTMNMRSESPGTSSFYGPTSVYPKEIMTPPSLPNASYHTLERWRDARLHESLRFNHENFTKALVCFFKYQHPQCMYIQRGAFLRDYKNLDYNSRYCSYPLLYAACSLGAKVSGDSQLYQHADFFSHVSYEMISKRSLESPHLTMVQTLLCLAFSELSQGRNPKGWMLSGMAFRMAQDLGLHQDPRFVASDDDTNIQDARDQEIRRHIYWGCYAMDKMQADDDDNTTGIPDLDENVELHQLLSSSLLQIAELSKIIEIVLSHVFSTKMIKKSRKDLVMTRLARLEELNLRLFRWHSALPESLTWHKWIQRTDDLHSNTLIMHVLYHSTLISLNRHFIQPTPGFARRSQSKEICLSSIDNIIAILRHYQTQCPLSRGPIVLIYGTIMAATALIFTYESPTTPTSSKESGNSNDSPQEPELDYQVTAIIKMLEEVSPTYPPAREASLRLKAYFGVSSVRKDRHQKQPIQALRNRSIDAGSAEMQYSESALDEQYWSQDPVAMWSSMDAGILNLMPMDWPGADDYELLIIRRGRRKSVHGVPSPLYLLTESELRRGLQPKSVLPTFDTAARMVPYSHGPAFDEGFLSVSSLHALHYEQYGKVDGKPALFLHGGPGGSTSQSNTIYFNPSVYRVVLFDQRGAGRSTPSAEIQENTTQHLIQDIEALRKHLQIAKWHLVFGGSWGSALALLYAQEYPQYVGSLVLRGICTVRKAELEWSRGSAGAARIYPDAYQKFLSFLSGVEREDPIKSYYKHLLSSDRDTRVAAAREWNRWDLTIGSLAPSHEAFSKLDDEKWLLTHATLEAHYFAHGAWIEDGQILRPQNVDKIRHIPATLIQGRYDIICAPRTAWDLHQAWPESRLIWVAAAGHSAKEPGIEEKLIEACDGYADLAFY